MEQGRQSPQEKKAREFASLVTPGNRRHAEARKDEKKSLTHVTRSKANELLAVVKPQLSSEDAELLAGELTAAHLRKSVNPKRARKDTAATLSQIIEWQLKRRISSFGRKTRAHPQYDKRAKDAVEILNSINNDRFPDVARRAGQLCSRENGFKFIPKTDEPVDRALLFLCRVVWCSHEENQALRRNEDLAKAISAWIARANRFLRNDSHFRQKKLEEERRAKRNAKVPPSN